MTTSPQAIKKLAKLLEYVLGRRPDEFGLVPDAQGFVKIKTLLQALHEDPEWRHVRQAELNTLVLVEHPAPIEIQEALIRARNREQLPAVSESTQMPKLLYTTIRQRAYPVVLDKGIQPGGLPYLLLSPDAAMAQRLGQRMDNDPVLLTVQVALAQAAGTRFRQYGELLYLADQIAVGAFSGPPLPKAKAAPAEPKAPTQPKAAGSFFPDLSAPDKHGVAPHQRPRRDEKEWKKGRRQARKEKGRQWG